MFLRFFKGPFYHGVSQPSYLFLQLWKQQARRCQGTFPRMPIRINLGLSGCYMVPSPLRSPLWSQAVDIVSARKGTELRFLLWLVFFRGTRSLCSHLSILLSASLNPMSQETGSRCNCKCICVCLCTCMHLYMSLCMLGV